MIEPILSLPRIVHRFVRSAPGWCLVLNWNAIPVLVILCLPSN
ncbi:hypothetical protein [Pseudomonas viridiflava]|nr:hypothetical protein [Pseudomonas viridiflava]MDY0937811.1 hypothetical protein [Pseudomonas viridiflava]MDY1014304.1 hypothetical protein [Pseudomonas viridiflava]